MKLRDDFSGATTELRLRAVWELPETNNFPFYQTQSVSQSAVSAASQVQAVMFVFVRKPTQSNQSIFFKDEKHIFPINPSKLINDIKSDEFSAQCLTVLNSGVPCV